MRAWEGRPILTRVVALPIAVTVLVAVGLSACSGEADSPPTESLKPAAPFEITLFGNENHPAGSSLSLSDLAGKPVVINFWYPSCPPCRLEMPDLEAAYQKHSASGVAFVGIQSLVLDTVGDGQQFIDEFGITYAVGPDNTGDILIDYEVNGFPTTVFVNEDHKVVRKWAGIPRRREARRAHSGDAQLTSAYLLHCRAALTVVTPAK